MNEEIKPPNQVKETIKDVLFQEVEESAKVLIRNVISPKSLGIAIIAWCLLSVGVSIYVRSAGLCDKPKVEAGAYFRSRLFCEIKAN